MAADPTTPADDVPNADEDLVAYLDGELDAATSQSVESKLAEDPATRTKAEAYRKTYDLLEYLPKPEPSPTFASRTMTKIDGVPVSKASLPSVPATSTGAAFQFNHSTPQAMTLAPPRHGRTFFLWSVAALVAAGVGYFGHLLAQPHLERRAPVQTSQQVHLLEHLPLYTGVDDLSFVKKLDDPDLFGEYDGEQELPKAPMTAAGESVSSTELAKLEGLFRKLPAARQQQLRQLDEDFVAQDTATQVKLHAVLERYAVWLENLPEDYRREILNAPAVDERIEVVRRVKNRIWRKHLPAAIRAKLDETTDADEQIRILTDVRKQDLSRREDWNTVRRQWAKRNSTESPFPFNDAELAKQVEDFTNSVLKPRLSSWELSRLDDLRKDTVPGGYVSWLLYGGGILRLSEMHPSLPEPRSGKAILKADDLPADFARRLRPLNPIRPAAEKRQLKDLPSHGKWPDFALAVFAEAQQRGVAAPPLGPCKPGEFKQDVDDAISVLMTKLTDREKADLEAKLGKWPDYPRLLMDLARRKDMSLPGVMLPGSPREWQKEYLSRGKN